MKESKFTPKAETKVNCGLYARVSTQGQMENDYSSLESQTERLREYCQSREGFEVYKVYEDGGFSGSTLERPAVKRLLQDIRDGKVNCVLTYKIDRIARSVKDFHNLIDFFDQYGVNFISITQSFDTQSAMGRLLRNILCDFAQFEREMISDRTKDKMQQRAQKGMWNGGLPPYGYAKIDKKLVLDTVESERVTFMFERFAKRPSLAALREDLHNRGWFARSGQGWGKTSIDHILRNPVYTGKVQSNGEIYDGLQPALVDTDSFEFIQGLRRDYRHLTTKIGKVFLLKGLLKCSDCGSVMTPHYTQKRRKDGSINRIPYYRCTRTMHYNNGVCSIKSVNAAEIERLVVDDLAELSQDELRLDRSIETLNREIRSQLGPLEKEVVAVRQRIADIEAELQKYVKALGKGNISLERLEREIETGEKEKRQLKSKLEIVTRQINDQAVSEFNAELVRKHLQNFQACFYALPPMEQAEALQCVLKNVIVEKEKIVMEIFELPEFVAGSTNRPVKLPRLDSNQRPAD
jgi:site-specific DNA recombinase